MKGLKKKNTQVAVENEIETQSPGLSECTVGLPQPSGPSYKVWVDQFLQFLILANKETSVQANRLKKAARESIAKALNKTEGQVRKALNNKNHCF